MLGLVLRPGKVQRTKAGKRKLRLFACGCCRLIWDLLSDPRLREAVEVAERFADGEAGKEDLGAAFGDLIGLTYGGYTPDSPGVQGRTAAHMALSCTAAKAASAALDMAYLPVPLAGYDVGGKSGNAILCDLLRDVFGNPFQSPPAVCAAWLAWGNGKVPNLAAAIYADRAFDRLPVLADALEDAGCGDADLLGHLRLPEPHVRGCWAVDLLLGKE